MVANIRNLSFAITSLLITCEKLSDSCTHEGPSPPFSAKTRVLEGSSTELSLSSTASSARLISSKSSMLPSFIDRTNGPSTHSKREEYFWKRDSTSRRAVATSWICRGSACCDGGVPSALPLANLRLFLFDILSCSGLPLLGKSRRYNLDSPRMNSTVSFGEVIVSLLYSGSSKDESNQLSMSSLVFCDISCAMSCRPRIGRNPPRRSLVSVLAWQLTTVSFIWRMTLNS
mmetsp:Transcript_4617/g.10254  ORF Transcript_4617/g.10254 Transcript_4617/m.10254 type:complete len:230 (+) Transcript_4617:1959-2648(+)